MENYSLNSKGIKQAANELINDNATYLIQYIYRQAGILDEPTIHEHKANDVAAEPDELLAASTKTPIDPLQKAETASSKPKDLKEAKTDLSAKAKNSVFKNVEVRIGLSIRILAKTNRYYDEELINLILDDIDYLRKESDYLLSFKDPKARKAALDEEYALVQGYIDMDDTISLNQEPDTVSKVGKLASDGQCTIQ